MKALLRKDREIRSFPGRLPWLEAMLTEEVLRGLEAGLPEAERARVLGLDYW